MPLKVRPAFGFLLETLPERLRMSSIESGLPVVLGNAHRRVVATRDRGMFNAPISANFELPSVATRDISTVATDRLLEMYCAFQWIVPKSFPTIDLSRSIAGSTSVRSFLIPGFRLRLFAAYIDDHAIMRWALPARPSHVSATTALHVGTGRRVHRPGPADRLSGRITGPCD
jgi:hypothetical protein